MLEKKPINFEKSSSLGIQTHEMQRDELTSAHRQKTKLLPPTNNCKDFIIGNFYPLKWQKQSHYISRVVFWCVKGGGGSPMKIRAAAREGQLSFQEKGRKEGKVGREVREEERECSLPFSSSVVAGKLPPAFGFRGLNATLPLFLRCLLMEELKNGHFPFFREYCEHKKSPTSDESWSSKPNLLSAWVSTSAIGTSPFISC